MTKQRSEPNKIKYYETEIQKLCPENQNDPDVFHFMIGSTSILISKDSGYIHTAYRKDRPTDKEAVIQSYIFNYRPDRYAFYYISSLEFFYKLLHSTYHDILMQMVKFLYHESEIEQIKADPISYINSNTEVKREFAKSLLQ